LTGFSDCNSSPGLKPFPAGCSLFRYLASTSPGATREQPANGLGTSTVLMTQCALILNADGQPRHSQQGWLWGDHVRPRQALGLDSVSLSSYTAVLQFTGSAG
jgi:hypothetical protein